MKQKDHMACRRLLAAVLVLVMVVVSVPLPVLAGDVNEDGYIEVRTIEDLYNIRNDMTANYILMNDIDLTEATAEGGDWDFMGNGWNPIGSEDIYSNTPFEGEFDGNGHKIIGMRIDVSANPAGVKNEMCFGLFANIAGYVHDLTILRGSIEYNYSKDQKSYKYFGALAGKIENADVVNVYSEMDSISILVSSEYSSKIGGISGNCKESVITQCASSTSITATTKNYVSGTPYVYGGGIVGYMESGTVSECFNTGDVHLTGYYASVVSYYSRVYAGGISAKAGNQATITRCYNAAEITAYKGSTNYANGISLQGVISQCYNIGTTVADQSENIAIGGTSATDCYYLAGCGEGNTGATSLTETQMKTQSMYAGFDFENTWVLNPYANHPYPQLRSNIQDLEESATLVSIISWPLKQQYYTGDELVLDGCMIDVTYASGRKEVLSVTEDMISGFDNTTAGEQTITVTYRTATDTFPVTVTERPVVTSVSVISPPNKTEFPIGTALDYTGAQIKVIYRGGASEIVNVTVDMTTGGNIHHLGKQTIEVSYYGKSDTFEITVLPVTIDNLVLKTLPEKLTYLEGEELDLTGLVLLTEMNNGAQTPVNSGYTVSGYTSETGAHTVTIGYMGKTVSFEVTVQAKSVVELTLKATPVKKEYISGQVFDPTGMTVIATYDNGDVEVVEDYKISGFGNTPGTKSIVVSYGGKHVAFAVTVLARVVTAFEITSYPAKLSYIEYETLDATGLVAMATYNDGITEAVTDYELVGFSSNVGSHTVSVAYGGWVDTFTVTVSPRVLTNLVVQHGKLTYYLGEEFDSNGMTVIACYNNGQQIQVEDYVLSGFDSKTAGTKKINVSYGGLSSEFSVAVFERSEVQTDGSFVVGNVIGRLGEEVRVPVRVTGNTGIAGMRHEISFNASNLKFVGVEMQGDFTNGTLVINEKDAAEGKITIVWFCDYDVKADGAVYELVFKIQETAADGLSNVSVNFGNGDNANVSGENVLFGTINGAVEVRSYWLGDLNGDRKYAMVDLVMLAQYVADFDMTMTEKQLLSADVNEDGTVDIHDVVLLNQWLLAEDY